MFTMSSMVGGAVGVAVLTALGRGLSAGERKDAARADGLSDHQIAEAEQALVGSTWFRDAIASLPADLRDRVTAAVVDAFSAGVADAMVVTDCAAARTGTAVA